jgi:hypothetical protein
MPSTSLGLASSETFYFNGNFSISQDEIHFKTGCGSPIRNFIFQFKKVILINNPFWSFPPPLYTPYTVEPFQVSPAEPVVYELFIRDG